MWKRVTKIEVYGLCRIYMAVKSELVGKWDIYIRVLIVKRASLFLKKSQLYPCGIRKYKKNFHPSIHLFITLLICRHSLITFFKFSSVHLPPHANIVEIYNNDIHTFTYKRSDLVKVIAFF
jgi:hypothetical protein